MAKRRGSPKGIMDMETAMYFVRENVAGYINDIIGENYPSEYIGHDLSYYDEVSDGIVYSEKKDSNISQNKREKRYYSKWFDKIIDVIRRGALSTDDAIEWLYEQKQIVTDGSGEYDEKWWRDKLKVLPLIKSKHLEAARDHLYDWIVALMEDLGH